MPQIELNVSSATLNLNYTISTPTSSSTTAVDYNLPCILFIHGEYLSHEVFEGAHRHSLPIESRLKSSKAQFSDPLLRKRFNLISLDLRGYGHTTTLAQADYTPAVAADDIYHFLNEFKIPRVHLFGVSIGCHIALELSLVHPEVVSSLTLCTMPSLQEPPEILAGRQEVFDFWSDSGEHQGDSTTEVTTALDEDQIRNLVRGIQLLLFGESTNPLAVALIGYGTTLAKTVWAGSPDALASAYIVLICWYARRRIFDVETLSQLKCPISVIHCEEDIAYTLGDSEEFVALLRDAKLEVDFHQVPGPHFGHVTNPELVNPIICERVLSVAAPDTPLPMAKLNGSRRQLLDTPFKKDLMQHGYRADDD